MEILGQQRDYVLACNLFALDDICDLTGI